MSLKPFCVRCPDRVTVVAPPRWPMPAYVGHILVMRQDRGGVVVLLSQNKKTTVKKRNERKKIKITYCCSSCCSSSCPWSDEGGCGPCDAPLAHFLGDVATFVVHVRLLMHGRTHSTADVARRWSMLLVTQRWWYW